MFAKTTLLSSAFRIRGAWSSLLGFVLFCLCLLLFRVWLTGRLFFLFLVWNLFLAMVPYLCTSFLRLCRWRNMRTIPFFTVLGCWLLFLPNSPYIITDLIHLQNELSVFPWYDLFLVFVFAFTGLLFGILSLWDVYQMLRERYSEAFSKVCLFIVCFLCGYGIYLGRFLRFNSWDVVSDPLALALAIGNSMGEPRMWFVTLAFGGFLSLLLLWGTAMMRTIGRTVSSSSD